MPPAWVTRHGGDEFLVVLPQLDSDEQAIALAQELMNQIRHPFTLEGYQLHVTPSVGIAHLPRPRQHPGRTGEPRRHGHVCRQEARAQHLLCL